LLKVFPGGSSILSKFFAISSGKSKTAPWTLSSAIRNIFPTSSAAGGETSDRKPVTDLGEKKPLAYSGSLTSCNVTDPCSWLIREREEGG